MSAPLFTPGPWVLDEDDRPGMAWNRHVLAGYSNRICFMSNPGETGNAAQSLANANLIASAPELYAAVIELTDAMLRYEMDVDADAPAAHREMMRKAFAALAKARGEA